MRVNDVLKDEVGPTHRVNVELIVGGLSIAHRISERKTRDLLNSCLQNSWFLNPHHLISAALKFIRNALDADGILQAAQALASNGDERRCNGTEREYRNNSHLVRNAAELDDGFVMKLLAELLGVEKKKV
jgi:hypothetical protein